MAPKRPGFRAKLALLLGSLSFLLLIALAAEGLVRVFGNVTLFGNSRELFVADAYGDSKGNARGIEAISFGATVYTDANGFRIPPPGADPGATSGPAILILGDSVGFGPGIEEHLTIAGRLRRSLPTFRIYNSSVIGYNTHDYKNLIEHFVPRHDEIRRVYLILCLNDISAESAARIDEALEARTPPSRTHALDLPGLRQVNDYLRSRSKLYMWIKNTLTDPSARYWKIAARAYAENAPAFSEQMQPLADIGRYLEARGIDFTVILSPYEYQQRIRPANRAPQDRLIEFLDSVGVRWIDALPVFLERDRPSRDFYLSGDPMHFSALGHELVQEIILADLR